MSKGTRTSWVWLGEIWWHFLTASGQNLHSETALPACCCSQRKKNSWGETREMKTKITHASIRRSSAETTRASWSSSCCAAGLLNGVDNQTTPPHRKYGLKTKELSSIMTAKTYNVNSYRSKKGTYKPMLDNRHPKYFANSHKSFRLLHFWYSSRVHNSWKGTKKMTMLEPTSHAGTKKRWHALRFYGKDRPMFVWAPRGRISLRLLSKCKGRVFQRRLLEKCAQRRYQILVFSIQCTFWRDHVWVSMKNPVRFLQMSLVGSFGLAWCEPEFRPNPKQERYHGSFLRAWCVITRSLTDSIQGTGGYEKEK